MPRAPRASSFLFEPSRFRNDPAVLAMTPEARGAYAMLLCAAWEQHEPGVINPATDAVLAQLAMVTMRTWKRIRNQIVPAFEISTSGKWRQRGLIESFRKQTEYVDSQRASGRKGGLAKAAKTLGSLERASSPSVTVLEKESEDRSWRDADASLAAGAALDLRPMIRAAAKAKAMPAPKPRKQEGLDLEAIKAVVAGMPAPSQAKLYALAGWLWKSGTPDTRIVARLIAHARENWPTNPHAFYAPNGKPRMELEAKYREQIAEKEKRDERAALAG